MIMTLGAICMALPQGAQAMNAIEAMQEVKKYIAGRFPSDDGRVYQAELPAVVTHMEPRYGKANKAGTPESPRLIWAVRVPADPLGNCVKVDAFKFNKNTPGLEIKVSTGKCVMFEREKLLISGGLPG